MLWYNHELLFIHQPKTGGTAIGRFLTAALPGIVTIRPLRRFHTTHPTLTEALEHYIFTYGHRPKCIVAAMRNPVDLVRSMYVFFRVKLRRNCIGDRRAAVRDMNTRAKQLEFNQLISYLYEAYGSCDAYDGRQFFVHRCSVPDELKIIYQESLGDDLKAALSDIELTKPVELQARVNVSPKCEVDISKESVAIIHKSFSWMTELSQNYAFTSF